METKKKSFFVKFKDAIVNFEEYKIFADEKTSTAFKYILKLMLMFVLILTVLTIWQANKQFQNVIKFLDSELPNFKFENSNLIIEGEKSKFIKAEENNYFGFIIDDSVENIENIPEINDYEIAVVFTKNKIVLKNEVNIEQQKTYEEIFNLSGLDKNLTKQQIINLLSEINMKKAFGIFAIIIFISLYIVYLTQILLDILLLSLVGYLLSKIINIKIKYKSIFNISAYALTLSTVLYIIYIILNTLYGINIKLFNIAYNSIAYVYIMTAMLMMKTDLMKTQMQLIKIAEIQKEVQKQPDEEIEKPKEKEEPK